MKPACPCRGCSLGLPNTCANRLKDTVTLLAAFHVRDALQAQLEAAERLRIAYVGTLPACHPELAERNAKRAKALERIAILIAKLQVSPLYGDGQRWLAALSLERFLNALAHDHDGILEEAKSELKAILEKPYASRWPRHRPR